MGIMANQKKINYQAEFIKAMEYEDAHKATKKTDWHAVYRSLNKNKDGGLDLCELLAWYRKTYPKCTAAAVEGWLNKHDKNKDGVLNEKEFVAVMEAQEKNKK